MAAKRTYFTAKDMMSFSAYTHSDERRFKLQKECHEKVNKGMINPIPWSISERQVTQEDFEYWKENIHNK